MDFPTAGTRPYVSGWRPWQWNPFHNVRLSQIWNWLWRVWLQEHPAPTASVLRKVVEKTALKGYAVAWMIMWGGQSYPIYGLKHRGHVQPHPIEPPLEWYECNDDDTVVHLTDADTSTVHANYGTRKEAHGSGSANCGWYQYCMCDWAFGWAIKGFADDSKNAMPGHKFNLSWASQIFVQEEARTSGYSDCIWTTKGSSYMCIGDSSDVAFTTTQLLKHPSRRRTYIFKDRYVF